MWDADWNVGLGENDPTSLNWVNLCGGLFPNMDLTVKDPDSGNYSPIGASYSAENKAYYFPTSYCAFWSQKNDYLQEINSWDTLTIVGRYKKQERYSDISVPYVCGFAIDEVYVLGYGTGQFINNPTVSKNRRYDTISYNTFKTVALISSVNDNSLLNVYNNATHLTSFSDWTTSSTKSGRLIIGSSWVSTGSVNDVYIQSIRIYKRALTENEVAYFTALDEERFALPS